MREAAKAEGISPYHVSGERDGTWILLDFLDVIVHIFLPGEREFYDLEALWTSDQMEQLRQDGGRRAARRRSA